MRGSARSLSRSALCVGLLLSNCAALSVACSLKGMFTPMRLSGYRGDGTITRIRFLPNPGVRVDFEEFSLARPYRTTYRLDGLPRRPFSYSVDIMVPGPHRGSLQGFLSLVLRDAGGRTIFHCQGSPACSDVSEGEEAECTFLKLYGPRVVQSRIMPVDFLPASLRPSTLEITWEPPAGSPERQAHIRMTSGGKF